MKPETPNCQPSPAVSRSSGLLDDGKSHQLTQSEADALLEMMEKVCALKAADNRKLLWLAMQTDAWKLVAEVYDTQNDIFNEIENRLYPEYDGDKVKATDWGWETPEGEIRYL